MEWGDPVMPSAISTVRDGRLWYRGADAVELARASQLEDVAAVLWESGDASVDLAAVPAGAAPPGEAGAIQPGIVAMAGRCVADLPTQGRSLGALRAEARGVLATLVVSMFGSQALLAGGSISQLAGGLETTAREPAIRQALCLLADHELNASTFATRVTISTGAGGCLETTARGTRHPAGAVSAGGPRAQCLDLRHARDDLDGASLSAGILSGLATLSRCTGGDEPETADRCDGACRCRPWCESACIRAWLSRLWASLYPAGDPRAPRCWKAWPPSGDPERRQAAPERRGLTAPAGPAIQGRNADTLPNPHPATAASSHEHPRPYRHHHLRHPISATTPARSARPSSPVPSPAWTRSSSWPTITR